MKHNVTVTQELDMDGVLCGKLCEHLQESQFCSLYHNVGLVVLDDSDGDGMRQDRCDECLKATGDWNDKTQHNNEAKR